MDNATRERLMRTITRIVAGLCVASIECFAFALLDTWTGVLRGTTLLVGQWVAMALTFGLIALGGWWASGVIVRSIEEERLPWQLPPRPAAFANEAEGFRVVDALPKATAPAGGSRTVRSERVRRIERMVQP